MVAERMPPSGWLGDNAMVGLEGGGSSSDRFSSNSRIVRMTKEESPQEEMLSKWQLELLALPILGLTFPQA